MVKDKIKPKVQVTGINHVVMYTADTHRARKFYTELLGLEVAEETDDSLFLWCGGPDRSVEQHIAFFSFGKEFVERRRDLDTRVGEELNHLCFQVDEADFERVQNALEEYGCKLVWREGADDELYFHDPDGHRLQVKMLGQPIKGWTGVLTRDYQGPENWRTQQ